jgi:hypothetical protein
MDEPNIRAFLTTIQVGMRSVSYTGSAKRTRWMNISCPFAPWTHASGSDSNPSFGITINAEGRSYYKCFGCGLKGSLAGMATRLGGYRKVDYSQARMWAESVEFKQALGRPVPDWEDIQDDDDSSVHSSDALPHPSVVHSYPIAVGNEYLRDRGLHFPTPYRLGIRFDPFQRRVLFPVYDPQNRFRGFTGRSIKQRDKWPKNDPKVRDYYGLNKRKVFLGVPPYSKLSSPSPNIIVEGLFDYARLVQAGYHKTRAILGTSLTDEKIDILIQEGEPVHFFMDNDNAGWTALFGTFDADGNLETENAWAFQLYKEIPVWIVPYPVPLMGQDPGSIAPEKLKNYIKRAWLFTGRAPLTEIGTRTFSAPF